MGVKARVASDIKLIFDSHIEASINASPFNGPQDIWSIEVKGKLNGIATLRAEFDGHSVASTTINVFTKVMLTLPREDTELGMLTN